MSDKGPLITRSKLREMKKEEEAAKRLRDAELQKEFEQKEQEIVQQYKKEKKKIGTVKGSRAETSNKIRKRSSFLTKAIVVVTILLMILFYFIFFG
ncbi:cell wall synthase accessory phosphoprotein MacP [Vagococcus xieshaowenii]|uniref:Uncharacterized protein n=1 Tax=Vagococcus xieshaowenii TaxID=2562451 RepID=A0AAJ5JMU9_9ENTE|nr:cell wall synthase accessory phosphoprotein MacP [Vagococcus xieshaowenii]QCA28912.1 hypothetical protein E4Z98_06100 [Vagococcus xieshaowenii]TFZ43330.1 hypothetical protein E4031_00470 [Vagococcus xieshaowenii]